MNITLTPQESESYFCNALCNGLDYMRGYGLGLTYNKDEYQASRVKMESPCFEDVLMQMLRDGYSLQIVDVEGEGAYDTSITMKEVYERVCQAPTHHVLDMVEENDDAETADAILQTVFFKEIIFG
jgi:hypothetical protein